MKFEIKRTDLLEALQSTGRVLRESSTLPALSHILLTATKDSLIAYASNLETSLALTVEAKAKEQGAVGVPAQRSLQIVKAMTGDKVVVDAGEDNVATFRCGDSRVKVHGLFADDFPPRRSADAVKFTLSSADLAAAISATEYCIGRDETRPMLNGAHLVLSARSLLVEAASVHQMAQREAIAVVADKAASGSWIVPSSALPLLAKLGEGEATVGVSPKALVLSKGNLEITTSLVEHQYPNLSKLIPTEWAEVVKVQREDLIDALKLVATVERGVGDDGVLVVWGKGGITLSVTSSAGEESETRVPCAYKGDDVRFSISAGYLLDALAASKADDVELRYCADKRPVGLFGDANTTRIIMPRLTE